MEQKKSIKLSSLVVWLPIKFSILSLLSFILTGFIYAFTNSVFHFTSTTANSILAVLLILAFILITFLTFRKLFNQRIDRYDFVAINNLQNIILGFAFLISSIILIKNTNDILLNLFWMETHSNIKFFLIIGIATIFYFYLFGLFLSNLFTKYSRCKTIGLNTWKIICSMPFGFSLLWIPGYILPDNTSKQTNISLSNRYNKFNKWVLSKQLNTYMALILIILLSSFFFGFRNILITLVMLGIFTIWTKQVDKKTFQKDLNKKYSYFAIGINIGLLIAFLSILLINSSNQTNNDININIIETSDIIK